MLGTLHSKQLNRYLTRRAVWQAKEQTMRESVLIAIICLSATLIICSSVSAVTKGSVSNSGEETGKSAVDKPQDRITSEQDLRYLNALHENDYSYHWRLLVEDFKDMVKPSSMMVYGLAAVPSAPLWASEKMPGSWEPTKGDPAFDFIDFFHGGGTPVAVSWFLMARGHFLGDRRSGDVGYTIFRSQLTATAFVRPMKWLIGRQRPDGGDYLSFPSGHAITTFAFANIIDKEYGHGLGGLAYTYALLSCWARVDEKEHYWSDIVYGAIVGWWLGEISYTNTHEFLGDQFETSIAISPVREGLFLACTVTF